jgi:hypothetical protein
LFGGEYNITKDDIDKWFLESNGYEPQLQL